MKTVFILLSIIVISHADTIRINWYDTSNNLGGYYIAEKSEDTTIQSWNCYIPDSTMNFVLIWTQKYIMNKMGVLLSEYDTNYFGKTANFRYLATCDTIAHTSFGTDYGDKGIAFIYCLRTYDRNWRLLIDSTIYADTNQTNYAHHYAYNTSGQLIAVYYISNEDTLSKTFYFYDETGFLKKTTDIGVDDSIRGNHSYTKDSLGRLYRDSVFHCRFGSCGYNGYSEYIYNYKSSVIGYPKLIIKPISFRPAKNGFIWQSNNHASINIYSLSGQFISKIDVKSSGYYPIGSAVYHKRGMYLLKAVSRNQAETLKVLNLN